MNLGHLAFALAAIASLAVFLVLARRRQDRIGQEWATLQAPEAVDSVQYDVESARYILDDSIKTMRETDDIEHALRMLDGAASLIEEATPDRLRRLKAMAKIARMTAALATMHPVSPVRFQLRRLSAAAAFGQVLDMALVGPAERFALRTYVLSYGFRLSLRVALHSQRRIQRRRVEWARGQALFETALRDWGVCDEEHLESFRALFGSNAPSQPQSPSGSSTS